MFTASLIETRTDERDKELWRRSLETPLRHYLTNSMFDETKLYVAAPGGRRAKRRRTIAHGCQITYQEHGATVTDVDVVRPPALVLRCTAASTAAVVGKPTDPCGIAPEVLPCAPYYGILTATDSHSVNKKVSKWISAWVDSRNKYSYTSAGTLEEPPPPTLPPLPLAAPPADPRPLPVLDTPPSMPASSHGHQPPKVPLPVRNGNAGNVWLSPNITRRSRTHSRGSKSRSAHYRPWRCSSRSARTRT